MTRRLLNVAVDLSLLAAGVLAVAGYAGLPGRPRIVGNVSNGWGVVAYPGTIDLIQRRGGGAVALSIPLTQLAIVFGGISVALIFTLLLTRRRRAVRGFPVEPAGGRRTDVTTSPSP